MPNDKPYIRPWNAPGKNGTETSMGSIYDWVDNLQENPDTLSPIFSVENAIPPQICDYIVKKSQVENDQFREAATGIRMLIIRSEEIRSCSVNLNG